MIEDQLVSLHSHQEIAASNTSCLLSRSCLSWSITCFTRNLLHFPTLYHVFPTLVFLEPPAESFGIGYGIPQKVFPVFE